MTARPDEAQTVTLEEQIAEWSKFVEDEVRYGITNTVSQAILESLRTLQRIQSAQGEAMPRVAEWVWLKDGMFMATCGNFVSKQDYDAAIAHLNGLLARERDAERDRGDQWEITATNLLNRAEAAERQLAEREAMMAKPREPTYRGEELHIVFDGPPSHESGRFVEVETADGKSVDAGEWVQSGDYWHLVLTVIRGDK